jgi:hypothetical protein
MLIIKEAFHIYVYHHLWRRVRGSASHCGLPSWAPALDTLGGPEHIKPPGYWFPLVYRAISAFKRNGSIVLFSDDCKILHTAGCFMGMITSWTKEFRFTTNRGYRGWSIPPDVDASLFLVALFGIRAPFVLKQVSLEPPTHSIVAQAVIDPTPGIEYFRHWNSSIKDADLGTDEDILAEQEREELVSIALV